MVRRYLLGFIITLGLLLIQSTWLQAIAILDITPDLALIFVVYLSFRNPAPQGQFTGFLAGIFQDGMSTAPLGMSAFIKTFIAWGFNIFSGKFSIDKVFIPFLFGFIATISKALANLFLGLVFSGRIPVYNFLSYRIWIEAAYNAVAAPILFLILLPFERFILPREKRL